MSDFGPIATSYVEVRPDTTSFKGEVDEAATIAGQSAGRNLATTMGQAIAAIGLGRYVLSSLGEADEARDIAAQTAAVIRSTGEAANVTERDIESLAGRLSDLAAVDDDVIQSGANVLLTFTNVRNEIGRGNDIFDRATEASLNMSVALGTDLQGAVLQVGKALNDPIAGLTSLARAGVQFTDQQKEQIRVLVESNDILGAQQIILSELERQFSGSAAAQASGLDRISVAAGNLKEAVGGAAAPAVEALAPLVETLVDGFGALPVPIQTTVVALGGIGVGVRPLVETVTMMRQLSATSRLAAAATALQTGATQANTVATAVQNTTLNSAVAVENLYAASSTRAAIATGTLRTAMIGLGIALPVIGLIAMGEAMNGVTVDIQKLGQATNAELVEGFRFVQAAGEDLRIFQQIASETPEVALRLRDALRDAGQATGEYDAILATTAVHQATLTIEQQIAAGAAEDNADATNEVVDAHRRLTSTTAALRVETQRQVDTLSRLDQIERERNDRIRDDLDTDLDLQESMLRTSEALDRAYEAWRDYGSGSTEAQQAVIDATRAAMDQADAAVADAEANNGAIQLSAKETADIQIFTLRSVADQLDPSSDIRRNIEGYIADLQRIPSELTTELFLNYGGGTLDLQLDDRRLQNQYRASGGPMYRGQTYTVGEDGEETVHMGADGTAWVTPGAGGRSGGRGGVYIENLYSGASAREIMSDIGREYAWAVG